VPANNKGGQTKTEHHDRCPPEPLRTDTAPQNEVIDFLSLQPWQLTENEHFVMAGKFPTGDQPG
jgi:hypothetical protein